MEENQPIQNPEPIKKEKKGCPLAVVIILAILAIGGTGFGVYELLRSDTEVNCLSNSIETSQETKEESTQDQPTQESTPENDSSQNTYDSQNIYNNRMTTYPQQLSENGIYYTYFDSSVYFYDLYNQSSYGEYYIAKCDNDNCKIYNYTTGEEFTSIAGFSKKIKHYYAGNFGNGAGYEQLLFIMDDGSVEAISLYEAFTNHDFTPKPIAGLENIIAIHKTTTTSISSENGETLPGSGATMLAEDKNGNYYDLYNYLDPIEFD